MITWILTIIAWVIFAVCQWAGFSGENWPHYLEKISLIVGILLALRAVFWLPFRRDEDQKIAFNSEKQLLSAQLESEQKLYAKEKERLEKVIESLRNPSALPLEIEGVPCEIKMGKKLLCQIRVHNKNPLKADNVQIEVITFEDVMDDNKQSAYYHPRSPFVLKPEIAGANSINPDQKMTYNLFTIEMQTGFAKSEEAISQSVNKYGAVTIVDDTRQADAKKEMSEYRVFIAYYMEGKSEKMARFLWKKSYPIKISAS